jgi:hypothetical protein
MAEAQQHSQRSERIKLQREEKNMQQRTLAAQEAKLAADAAQRRVIANAQDEEIILAAQQRIAARQPAPADENKPTFKVKKPARKSDANMLRQEKRLARLTADKEYLKHGERCKNEALSEDEREEILAELETQQAIHLLFNPKAPIPRTKHGYIGSLPTIAKAQSISTKTLRKKKTTTKRTATLLATTLRPACHSLAP